MSADSLRLRRALFFPGLAALGLGALTYGLGRPLPVGGWLPDFLHSFAFALMLTALARDPRRSAPLVCALWASVELLFEAGQHPRVIAWLGLDTATWLPALARRYFSQGHFDIRDLMAVVAGAVCAWALVRSRAHG